MKSIILSFTIGLFLLSKLEAQKIEITGKILFLYTHDTIAVTFIIPTSSSTKEIDYEKLQEKVTYLDSTGKKRKITPDQAKEITFDYEDQEVRVISCYDAIGLNNPFSNNTNIFLKLETDGKLKLFTYYHTTGTSAPSGFNGTMMISAGESHTAKKYILQKGQEAIMKPTWMNYRKDLISYFNDCPKISQMIDEMGDNKYVKDNIESIVDSYNSSCGK